MNGEQLGEKLGQLGEGIKHVSEKVDKIDRRLDAHINSEEGRLKHIEQQLSLGRFLFLTAKALALTAAAVMAFKFGDVVALWKAVIK